jgi:hypothetical protein
VTALLELVLVGVEAEEEEVTAGMETVPVFGIVVERDVGMMTDVAKVASVDVETAATFGVETAAPDAVEDLALQTDFLVLVEVLFKYGAPEV